MRKMFVLVLLAALLAVAVPVGAAPSVPDNYCTEVVITPIVGGTYDIGCIFTPPPPLSVEMDYFIATR